MAMLNCTAPAQPAAAFGNGDTSGPRLLPLVVSCHGGVLQGRVRSGEDVRSPKGGSPKADTETCALGTAAAPADVMSCFIYQSPYKNKGTTFYPNAVAG